MTDLFGAAARPQAKPLRCLPRMGRMRGARIPLPVAPPPKSGPREIIIADSFAGGGGASEGIEEALRLLAEMRLLPSGHDTKVDFAVNHDEAALAMHKANHPRTIHLPHNVWKVRMREILGDNYFGLLWLSPDCRDHSPAKGGPITSRSVRDLAWVLVKWLKELPDWQRPWTICLENVPAFSRWSPLIPRADGKGYERDLSREGEIFHRLVKAVCAFGFSAGWHEAKSCNFGDPTIRNRLFLVFRRDGQRVVFPEPDHGDPKSEAVRQGKLKPWPVAADIVDFWRPCPSIFMDQVEARAFTKATGIKVKRPLAVKSDARLAKGVKRHALDAGDEAFIATCNHGGDGFRGQGLGEPFNTVTRSRDAHGLVVPHLMTMRNSGKPTSAADEPTHTIMAGGAHQFAVETAIAPFMSRGQHGGGNRSAVEPHGTIAASDGDQNQVVAAHLAPFVAVHNSDCKADGSEYVRAGRSVEDPLGAATTSPTQSLVVPYLVPRYGEREGQQPRSYPIDKPAPTPVPDGNGGSLAAVYLAQHNTGEEGHSPGRPVSTIVQKGCTQGVVAASLVEMCSDVMLEPVEGSEQVTATFIKREFGNSIGSSMTEPTGTVTAGGGGKTQVVAAHMLSLKGSDRRDGSCREPHNAVLAGGGHSAVVTLPLMTAYYSTGGQLAAIDDPMLAVPTKARFGLAEAEAAPPPLSPEQLAGARRVAAWLRSHGCWDGGEIVTVTIRGVVYVIIDVGMRMLTPRELARAQGFRETYILNPIFNGKPLSETEQRHKIGNSVTRKAAAAHIVANYRPPMSWGREVFLEAAE